MAEENMEALMQAAANADAAGVDIASGDASGQAAGNEGGQSAESQNAGAAQETKSPEQKAAEQAAQAATQEKTKSKFAQERERKDKTWEQINAEKETLKKERETLAKEREEWKKQAAEKPAPFRDEKGFTAEDYLKAAEKFKADGDQEMAAAAQQKAQQLQFQAQKQDFDRKWTANWDKLAEQHPELKDFKSPMFLGIKAIMNQFPILKLSPDGILYAMKAYQIEERTKGFDSVTAENKTLKQQLDELQKKLSLPGGKALSSGAGAAGEAKAFEKMTMDEQHAHLQKLAAEADGI